MSSAVIMKLQVRLAQAEDREGVLDISKDLYGDTDYIPHLYNSYIADPNRRSLVGLIDDRLVGYLLLSCVDDGQTILAQAARIHPDFRSTGIWRHIRQEQFGVLQDFPKVKRVVLTTANRVLHIQRYKDGKTGMAYLFSRISLALHMSWKTEETLSAAAASLAGLFTSLSTLQQIKPLTPNSIFPVVQDLADRLKLFPHDRLVLSWEPFMLLESNLKKAVEDDQGFAYITNDSRNSPLSLSIGHINGITYDIEYYGGDIRDAAAHVFVHLQNMKTLNNYSTLRPYLFLPEQLDVELVGELLMSLFSVRLGSRDEVAVFECKVKDYEIEDRKVWSKL